MAKWIVRAYAVVLLIYTGWRTYDFISSNLPKDNINFWLSIAFLFSTEAGLIVWHELHLKHVTTSTQDNLAHVMTWIDFVGSLAAGIGDMVLRQVFIEGYTMPPMLAQFLLYGLPCIMGANVMAIIIFEMNDAETLEEKAEKSRKFAIHKAAMKRLQEDEDALVEEKADQIFFRMRGRVTDGIDKRYGNAPHLPRRVRQPGLLGMLFHKWTRGISESINNYLGDGTGDQVTVYPAETQALPDAQVQADPTQPHQGKE